MGLKIAKLADAGQDFEFYPTTDEIIDAVKEYERKKTAGRDRRTIADPCAGDGRFLMAFDKRYTYLMAYELSAILRARHPSNITFAGVDYMASSLSEVSPDAVLCNPPYSDYVGWVNKVLREVGRETLCFFVIPQRWRDAPDLRHLLDAKTHSWDSLGIFTFAEAERRARAVVEVIAVDAYAKDKGGGDELDRFFRELNFYDKEEEQEVTPEEESEVARRANIIVRHVSAYERRMSCLRQAIIDVSKIPYDVRAALELQTDAVKAVVRNKMRAAREEAWDALFREAEELNKRLTRQSTRAIRRSMEAAGRATFNTENVGAVLTHMIQHANNFADDQIVWLFERLAELANIENYKSNHKVYVRKRFSYAAEDAPTHIRLGHRVVLERCGGLDVCTISKPRKSLGLSDNAAEFLNDLFVVAYTLGYQMASDDPEKPLELPRSWQHWDDNARQFYCKKNGQGKLLPFAHVRVFMNGNMHIKLLPEFVHVLSAKHGVLKGWLRSDVEEMASELGVSKHEAEAICTTDHKLGSGSVLALLC